MSDPRTLRSKKLRAALFLSSDGRCAICGDVLKEGWHADHIVPWSRTGRTNVHEMQATCPRCNLRKGVMMTTKKEWSLRKHQADLRTYLARLTMADLPKRILMHVTPGGGKSVLPQLNWGEVSLRRIGGAEVGRG